MLSLSFPAIDATGLGRIADSYMNIVHAQRAFRSLVFWLRCHIVIKIGGAHPFIRDHAGTNGVLGRELYLFRKLLQNALLQHGAVLYSTGKH